MFCRLGFVLDSRPVAATVCWNVVWSLVEMDGGVEDFDYLSLAEELLDWLSPV